VEEFARAGADVITVHAEATPHLHHALAAVRNHGCLAGAAINPSTSPQALAEVPQLLDLALCMSVDPGWGGQAFIPASLSKLARLRDLLGGAAIEVDGGVDPVTAAPCAEHGATLLVAGSAVFRAAEPAEAYAAIVAAAGAV
jgi:ribulose-phosphate 3-epimerase